MYELEESKTVETRFPSLSASQKKRAAGPAIDGYLYQFEHSLLRILESSEGSAIRLEGIEDVDLWDGDQSTAVQVKYYSSQKYGGLKSLAKPIFQMLKSFAQGTEIEFTLHVHFGRGGNPPLTLKVEELEECLSSETIDQGELSAIKGHLTAFSDRFKIQPGKSMEVQRDLVIKRLTEALACEPTEAETLHRMRAVQLIQERSAKPNEQDRILDRTTLINFLSIREILYTRWHFQEIGLEKFINASAKKLKSEEFFRKTRTRGILISPTEDEREAVVELAVDLAQEMYEPRTLKSTIPWTLVLDVDDQFASEIKKDLVKRKVWFNDGYEGYGFSLEYFSKPHIYNVKNRGDLLSKWSFDIRIMTSGTARRISREDIDCKLSRFLVAGNKEEWQERLCNTAPVVFSGLSIKEFSKIIEKGRK